MSIKEDSILTKAINKKVSRRSFIKWSSALGATASMSGLVMQTGAKVAGAGSTNVPAAGDGGTVAEWKPTVCLVCHSWCHIAVGVDSEGHCRKIEGAGGQPISYSNGNPAKHIGFVGGTFVSTEFASKGDDANHIKVTDGFMAYAPHNKGRICAKGNDGLEHLYNADRVKYPLKRNGDRGSGQWKRITWDAALTEIADVLRELGNRGGLDLRHRAVFWVGRNENKMVGRFSNAYGFINHIEHTSLCEVSRHMAARSLWGHHWNSIDLEAHQDGYVTGVHQGNIATLTLDSNQHDVDYYIEWGGNPAEAKIPHSTCANHLADRRRRNLTSKFTGSRTTPAYGRIACIDVRQSNTAAFADEYFEIIPGTDGALALGILRYVLDNADAGGPGSTEVRTDLDLGHLGNNGGDFESRHYFGMFTAEEEGGLASGSTATSVIKGKSLESYVKGIDIDGNAAPATFADHLGGGGNGWANVKARVLTETGFTAAQFDHLCAVFAGEENYINVVCDTYRGPCKHTNGMYNTRAIRALQAIAPNYASAQHQDNEGVPVTSRGGIGSIGALQGDKNMDAGSATQMANPKLASGASKGGANPSTAKLAPIPSIHYPVAGGDSAHTVGGVFYQRLDNWDYSEGGVYRWRSTGKWQDQNLQAGIRTSLGMHPFNRGQARPAGITGPYDDCDATYKVEALLIHKNSPTYARPQQDNEIEMLTKKDANGNYLLANFWAIDLHMGDGSRFADIILPDVSYLERYSWRSDEGGEYGYRHDALFHRLPVFEVDGPTVTAPGAEDGTLPRHLHDSRQVSAILYELGRKIEPGNTAGTMVAPWNGNMYNSFKFHPSDTNTVASNTAAVNDGEWIMKYDFNELQANAGSANDAAVTAGADNGADYARTHGMVWDFTQTPQWWRTAWSGDGSEVRASSDVYTEDGDKGWKPTKLGASSKLTIFNEVLDTCPDIGPIGSNNATFATKADGTFFGTPVYIRTIQQTDATYDLHLTTYKLNVHTQSRTACLPRLSEIIGSSWAVIHPDTALANGSIVNGDTVTVTSSAGSLTCEAKVTPKAQVGCIHISTSQGHRAGIDQIGADDNLNHQAFGTYKVLDSVSTDDDGNSNPEFGQLRTNRLLGESINNPGAGSTSPIDSYVLALPPSAPGKGTHPNTVIEHRTASSAYGEKIASDPVGGSQAWFDTKVNIVKA